MRATCDDLTGVEICATGTWRGSRLLTFTTRTFDEMVANFQKLAGQLAPPVKLGRSPDSQRRGFREHRSGAGVHEVQLAGRSARRPTALASGEGAPQAQ